MCCSRCVCVCRWTAGCRRCHNACPYSHPCATIRRWLGSFALSTVRLRLACSGNVGGNRWHVTTATVTSHDVFFKHLLICLRICLLAERLFIQCFVLFFSCRPMCFSQVVPVYQNQNRQPGNTYRLDSAGPTGNTHRLQRNTDQRETPFHAADE